MKKNIISYDENGLEHGTFIRYEIDGKIDSIQTYSHGIRHGCWFDYYISGALYGKWVYINGNKHGEYIEYYDDGNIRKKCYYNKGVECQYHERHVYICGTYYWTNYYYGFNKLYKTNKNKFIL